MQELSAQYFPHDIYTNETTGFSCIKQEQTFYTPEELVAMMMTHAKDMTLAHGGKVIKDCVITVPSHFTYHERRALYTAAHIADLRVLTLVEENTAAALHYGMDRVFDTPTTVLYYNMGSSSVQVTIVTYSSYTTKETGKNKPIGQFEVIGKAWDSSLGGFNFDVKLAELMARRFNEVWGKKASGKGKDLRDFVRPMTRLRSEAVKVKEVLSANTEYPVKAEQLHDETDLVTKITRSDFEAECADLFARITAPIDKALAEANITLSEVQSVELLGGGVRVPKVKRLLDEYFTASQIEVGQHLNGDEAMALGAAFRAANLSTSFKVRKVGQSDINNFGISIHMEALPSEDKEASGGGLFGLFGGKKDKTKEAGDAKEDKWSKIAEIFPPKLTLSSKLRTVTFPFDEDVVCKIEYTDPSALPLGTDSTIAVFNITGISKFAKEASKKNSSPPKIHLSFGLDSDGVVSLIRAEATSDLPETAAAPVEEPVAEAEVSANETDAASESNSITASEGESNANSTDIKADKKAKKDKKPKKEKAVKKETTLRQVLTVQENLHATHPAHWDEEAIQESRLKLRALQLADEARKAKEAALNELEAYIYRVKNRLSDEETAIASVSNAEQRSEVERVNREAEEWLEEANSHTTTVTEYISRLRSIKDKAEPVFHRLSETVDRPRAVKKLQDALAAVREKVAAWPEKLPQVTEKETQEVLDAIAKVDEWVEFKLEKQLATAASETPAFDSKEVPLQLKPVQVIFDRLSRKPKPPPEKVD